MLEDFDKLRFNPLRKVHPSLELRFGNLGVVHLQSMTVPVCQVHLHDIALIRQCDVVVSVGSVLDDVVVARQAVGGASC